MCLRSVLTDYLLTALEAHLPTVGTIQDTVCHDRNPNRFHVIKGAMPDFVLAQTSF